MILCCLHVYADSFPTGQPTGNPTFLNNQNETYRQFEFGLKPHTTSTSTGVEGTYDITGIGQQGGRDVYLSMLLWPSGFSGSYVGFFVSFNNVWVRLDTEGSGANPEGPYGTCQPTYNTQGFTTGDACKEIFFPCRLNIKVTDYIQPELGGTLRLKTNSTITSSTADTLPCRKTIVTSDTTSVSYAIYVKFVVGDKEYGACNLGTYFEPCSNADPDCQICFNCPSGKYGNETISSVNQCHSCGEGTFSNPGSTACSSCQPGYFSPGAGVPEKICPKASYADVLCATECKLCPIGKTTLLQGLTKQSDCFSLVFNFFIGVMTLIICVPLALHYIFKGRFRRIAFFRKTRVMRLLNMDTHSLISYMSYFTHKTHAEQILKTGLRRIITWIFIISNFAALPLGFAVQFVAELGEVLFKSMVLLKSMNLDVISFGEIIKSFIIDIVDSAGTQWFNVLIWDESLNYTAIRRYISPIADFLDALAYFKVDLTELNITCQGSSAPLELLINMFAFGIVIVVIQGNFQPYRLVTYNRMVELSNEMFASNLYMQWFSRERGQHIGMTILGTCEYTARLLLAICWHLMSSVDIFQYLLIFGMSIIYLDNFISKGHVVHGLTLSLPGIHPYTDSCNDVRGYVGTDANLAYAASGIFWFLAFPVLFEIANIIIPGLPPSVEKLDVVDKEKEDFQHWYGMHKYLKLFSYVSPDLLWAAFANAYVQNMTTDIPSAAGYYVKSIQEAEAAENVKAAIERNKVVPVAGVMDGEDSVFMESTSGVSKMMYRESMMVTTDDVVNIESKLVTAIEKPLIPTFSVEVSPRNGYVAIFSCKKIIRDTKIFEKVHLDKTLSGQKYILLKINRYSGILDFIQTYDIYSNGLYAEGRSGTHLAKELNVTSDEFIVIVATIDSSMNHLQGGLPEAMYRCGASTKMFGGRPLLRGYILIGVPGSGEAKGFEVKPKESSPELYVDFSVLKGGEGFYINETVSSGRVYIESSMAARTVKENIEWKEFNVEQLPRYWALCELEYNTLESAFTKFWIKPCLVNYFTKTIWLVLVLCGVGHLLTRTGRRAIYVVAWKYVRFFQVVLGIWTDDLVEMYQIHETVYDYSAVWDDPFVRREMHERDALESKATRKASAHLSASSENPQNRFEYHDKRRKQLKGINQQLQLKKDYGSVLYATIATRATFLQLIPYVSVLSIFASFTAACPIFVFSLNLKANLKPGIINDALTVNVIILQQECDRAWETKVEESTEESYTLPFFSAQSEFDDYGDYGEDNLSTERFDIENKNAISRERQVLVMLQSKHLIRKWQAYFGALGRFLNESRYILYIKGVLKCTLCVLLLSADAKLIKVLSILSIIVFFPFSLANGFDYCIFVGKALWITDEELYRELFWLARLCSCFRVCFCQFCMIDENAVASQLKPKDVELSRDETPNPDDEELDVQQRVVINPLGGERIEQVSGKFAPKMPRFSARINSSVLNADQAPVSGKFYPNKPQLMVRSTSGMLDADKAPVSGKFSPNKPQLMERSTSSMLYADQAPVSGKFSPNKPQLLVRSTSSVPDADQAPFSGKFSPNKPQLMACSNMSDSRMTAITNMPDQGVPTTFLEEKVKAVKSDPTVWTKLVTGVVKRTSTTKQSASSLESMKKSTEDFQL